MILTPTSMSLSKQLLLMYSWLVFSVGIIGLTHIAQAEELPTSSEDNRTSYDYSVKGAEVRDFALTEQAGEMSATALVVNESGQSVQYRFGIEIQDRSRMNYDHRFIHIVPETISLEPGASIPVSAVFPKPQFISGEQIVMFGVMDEQGDLRGSSDILREKNLFTSSSSVLLGQCSIGGMPIEFATPIEGTAATLEVMCEIGAVGSSIGQPVTLTAQLLDYRYARPQVIGRSETTQISGSTSTIKFTVDTSTTSPASYLLQIVPERDGQVVGYAKAGGYMLKGTGGVIRTIAPAKDIEPGVVVSAFGVQVYDDSAYRLRSTVTKDGVMCSEEFTPLTRTGYEEEVVVRMDYTDSCFGMVQLTGELLDSNSSVLSSRSILVSLPESNPSANEASNVSSGEETDTTFTIVLLGIVILLGLFAAYGMMQRLHKHDLPKIMVALIAVSGLLASLPTQVEAAALCVTDPWIELCPFGIRVTNYTHGTSGFRCTTNPFAAGCSTFNSDIAPIVIDSTEQVDLGFVANGIFEYDVFAEDYNSWYLPDSGLYTDYHSVLDSNMNWYNLSARHFFGPYSESGVIHVDMTNTQMSIVDIDIPVTVNVIPTVELNFVD